MLATSIIFGARERNSCTSALVISSGGHQVGLVKLLLQLGADANVTNAQGHGSLDIARDARNFDMIKLLSGHADSATAAHGLKQAKTSSEGGVQEPAAPAAPKARRKKKMDKKKNGRLKKTIQHARRSREVGGY